MADWIIAYWHHPPYTWGTHHSDFEGELIEMRENIVPILEAQGVDLVLTGHSHVYERSMLLRGHFGYSDSFDLDSMALNQGWGREEVDGAYTKPAGGMGLNRGTVYVVCGNSGQGGEFEVPPHPAMRTALTGYGSVVIDITSNRLDCAYLSHSGGTEDHFTIIKGDSDEDRPPLTWRRGPSGIELTWPTSEPPFYLEHGSPAAPATWAPHEGVLERVGRRWRVLEPLPGPGRFWRLKRD